MTTIRLVYDPFKKSVRIYNDSGEITSTENRVWAFLNTNGFYGCLQPFRKKYVIWEGLLPELVREVNDEELQVVFEGRKSDYELVKKAFSQSGPVLEEAGYENKWKLMHTENFEIGNAVSKLEAIALDLREICETRLELNEIDQFMLLVKDGCINKHCRSLQDIISSHIEKWRKSENIYKQEKILYLQTKESFLHEIKDQAKKAWGK